MILSRCYYKSSIQWINFGNFYSFIEFFKAYFIFILLHTQSWSEMFHIKANKVKYLQSLFKVLFSVAGI